MDKIKESDMIARMKQYIDEMNHGKFVGLYMTWFPLEEEIDWDKSGSE